MWKHPSWGSSPFRTVVACHVVPAFPTSKARTLAGAVQSASARLTVFQLTAEYRLVRPDSASLPDRASLPDSASLPDRLKSSGEAHACTSSPTTTGRPAHHERYPSTVTHLALVSEHWLNRPH
jgi:hypothetical protein